MIKPKCIITKAKTKIDKTAEEYKKLINLEEEKIDNDSKDSEKDYPRSYGGRSGPYNEKIVANADEIFNNEILQHVKLTPDIKWISAKEVRYIYENMVKSMVNEIGVVYLHLEEKDIVQSICLSKQGIDPIELIGKATCNLARINNKYSTYLAATIFITLCRENSISINIKSETLLHTLNKVKYNTVTYDSFINMISGDSSLKSCSSGMVATIL